MGIRVQIGEDVYGFLGLPFGWAHNPALAQELLGMFPNVRHPKEVVIIQYLDDVLAINTLQRLLSEDTRDLADRLQAAGWMVSPKSELTPSPTMQWMGKHIDGHHYTIKSDAHYLASLMLGLVALCTTGYGQQRLRRFAVGIQAGKHGDAVLGGRVRVATVGARCGETHTAGNGPQHL